MTITVEATYENGILRPKHALALAEGAEVRLTVSPVNMASDVKEALDAVERTYGLIRWTGDAETLRRIAEDDEFGILESP